MKVATIDGLIHDARRGVALQGGDLIAALELAREYIADVSVDPELMHDPEAHEPASIDWDEIDARRREQSNKRDRSNPRRSSPVA